MPINDYLTMREAAEELGVTPDALRFAIRRGLITPTRVHTRMNLVTREQVERYRREHLGQQGKRATPDNLTERQRKQRAYQQAYYLRRKAARLQPATEPAE
jgi:DNA-binding transcriptional MerR regulator